MITLKETTYKNFGKCLSMTNGLIELYVTIDIGPRIIKCNYVGKENLMFNDVDRKYTEDVSSLFGEGKTFYNFGGQRVWMSPEKFPDTYYPDSDKVLYTILNNGAIFTAVPQDKTGIQIEVKVELEEDKPSATVTTSITNTQKNPITGSVWCLAVLDENGAVVIPQPTEDTGLLNNRVLALWPYTKMTDKRMFWGDRYIALRQDPSVKDAIKFGINNTTHKAAYVNKGQALVKDFDVNHPNGIYPDNGMSCEVYACENFTECETLSELKTIKKGEKIVHVERWSLFDNVDIAEFSNESLDELAKIIF
ncbi:MAG: DUF4380 domain-containing protein [Clostridia bacterium]|nr:DUF4380 domain-containing protein [Clostridia bacterium]